MSEKKILVVDDEKAIINLFKQAFARAGVTVVPAVSGEAALKVLEQEEIFVMFLDLNLPGMNGIELCRRIKKDKPMAIVFAVTGYASLFELVDCREAGFEDYFKKPADIKILIKAATEAFERLDRWKKK
ncbi:MAG: response regulator [Desulfobacterales bacterium RIFOXYA12_FULL_46_15]|nr:MAG: response regulator [Desulfobacterales bacterium RIFOXYA12_FULL_46_15]